MNSRSSTTRSSFSGLCRSSSYVNRRQADGTSARPNFPLWSNSPLTVSSALSIRTPRYDAHCVSWLSSQRPTEETRYWSGAGPLPVPPRSAGSSHPMT